MSDVCPGCMARDETIAQMRAALVAASISVQEALRLSHRGGHSAVKIMGDRFGLTPQLAMTLEMMFRVYPKFMKDYELADALPTTNRGASKRMDPNFRTYCYGKVLVSLLRKRLGYDAIETMPRVGYRLSNDTRKRVEAALESA